MALYRAILLGVIFLIETTLVSKAQQPQSPPYPQPASQQSQPYPLSPYQQYTPYPTAQAPAHPPSWYYNPYTSGVTACSRPDVHQCHTSN